MQGRARRDEARVLDAASPDAGDVAAAWQAYWATRSNAARNVLAQHYAGLVELVVDRLPSGVQRRCERGDLSSWAWLGLIDAIRHFVPGSRLEVFPGYARKRMRGTIFDELRRLDFLPRRARLDILAFREAEASLAAAQGRSPSAEEVLDALRLAGKRRAEVLGAAQTSLGPLMGEGPIWAEAGAELGPEEAVVREEARAELFRALASLPERQRYVLEACVLGDELQAEVAVRLGVTASRVCQIRSAALARLRELLVA